MPFHNKMYNAFEMQCRFGTKGTPLAFINSCLLTALQLNVTFYMKDLTYAQTKSVKALPAPCCVR